MNDYSALLALQDIGEPSIGELAAEIAEVEGLLLGALPFVFGWPEFVAHDLVLKTGLGERLGLEDEDAGHDGDQQGDHHGDRKYHLIIERL